MSQTTMSPKAVARRRHWIGPRMAGIPLTPQEFDALPQTAFDDRYRYELIHGVLVVTPPVEAAEADPNDELGHLLRNYQETHPQGAELDCTMPERTVPGTPNRRRCDRAIWTGLGRVPNIKKDVPSIVAEFVSRRRRDILRDYEQKRDEYLAAGVSEYWVIDRFRRIMTVYHMGYSGVTHEIITEAQTYETRLLPGFVLPLARLLAKADTWSRSKHTRGSREPKPETGETHGEIRRAYEALFLGLFLFFLLITDLRYLKGWPVSLFLEATPLVAVTTALTTHTIYRNLVWGLVIIAITMMLGRVWCNWMCPFGILHHLFGWIGNRRNTKQMIESNRYRKIYAVKYYILAAMLAMASLWIVPTLIDAPGQIVASYRGKELPQAGVARVFAAIGDGLSRSAGEHKAGNSTLQIGLLDPIALTVRSMTTSVLPTVHKATEEVYTEPREYWQAWVVGLIFIGFLVANWWIPRFFCRAICPLGALLGIFSRFALWRIDRDPVRCTDCDLCLKSCEGASDPQLDLRKSECFVCMNCIDDCPHDALSFRFLPRKASEVAYPAVRRRPVLLAGLFGLLFFPMARLSGGVRKNFNRGVIRPPGSVAEDEFLRRCIKCDQCIRVCPTNVLQPSLFEAGLEGLWTPIMISKMGWCELNCTLCSQVCPTGAIREISIAEKLGVGPFEGKGPVKTGTAFYNQGRCLPWAMDTSCVVCEEVCPVSPKAIFTRNVEVTDRWGATIELKRPYIDPVKCIGCGICEHECPVKDDPAVYVTAIGETRDKSRSLLLSLVDGAAQDWVSV